MDQQAVPQIFDKQRRVHRFRRAFKLSQQPDSAKFLFDDMVADMIDRVGFMQLRAGNALIIGDLTGKLGLHLHDQDFGIWDTGTDALEEELPYPDPFFEYIFSLGTLDTVNDLPGALMHIYEALPQGGLFIGQIVGAGSLPKLREIMLAADGDRPAPRIHPMIDSPAASALLQRAGFGRQVVDSHTLSVRYSSLDRLIRDLRDQGQTNTLMTKAPAVGKSGLLRAQEAFERLREQDGKVTESFEMVTLTGWKH